MFKKKVTVHTRDDALPLVAALSVRTDPGVGLSWKQGDCNLAEWWAGYSDGGYTQCL